MSGVFFGQSSFATHVIASVRTAVKVPRDVPLHLLGPLGCGMLTGAASVIEALKVRPGQSIAVFGTGSVGMAEVMAARIVGASRIVAIDIDEPRLALAHSLGASDALLSNEQTAESLRRMEPRGFDFSFITAPSASVFDAAVACLAIEGAAGFVVAPASDWRPDMLHLLTGGRKLQGIIGGNANPQTFIPLMIDYWREGLFPFDQLIAEFPFDRIDKAWRQFRAGEVVKPILRMP